MRVRTRGDIQAIYRLGQQMADQHQKPIFAYLWNVLENAYVLSDKEILYMNTTKNEWFFDYTDDSNHIFYPKRSKG
jgi:hypothetical protein